MGMRVRGDTEGKTKHNNCADTLKYKHAEACGCNICSFSLFHTGVAQHLNAMFTSLVKARIRSEEGFFYYFLKQ